MFTTNAPRITVRFVALLTAVSLVLSVFPAAFFVANAEGEIPPVDTPAIETPVEEVTIPAEEPAPLAAAVVVDEPTEGSATIIATKIICDDEADLPNWGSTTENADITADTAEDWVAAHEGCRFAKGWQFQWAPYGSTGNPGDTLVGEAGAPWTTFSYSTTIPQSAFETGVWVREVLQDGYIPFTYNPGKENTNDVSAELYCNTDVLNYDNIDYVGGIEDEGTYYCVAWNVLAEDPVEPTHEITGIKWNDENGNGVREEGEEGLAGWTIVAENDEDESSVSTTTDATGHYTLLVPDGEWTVREVQQQGWEQTSTRQNGDYLVETNQCSFYFGEDDEVVLYKSLSSKLLNDEVIDYENTCDFGNHYYYETITACKLTEDKQPVDGWTMGVTNYASEGEDYYEMTTGEDGCASVDVDPNYGPWIVEEEMKDGWSQVDVLVTNGDIYNYEDDSAEFCVFFNYRAARSIDSGDIADADPSYSCTFINNAPDVIEEPEQPTRGGSTGTRTKRAPRGQVLGATTQCGLWLNDYMQKATENDTYQVLKLQVFLTLQGYATPLTGIFDDTTEANVKLFQAKYADTVIKPWFEKGIVPHNRPTGFVYKTTRWQINDIMCPGIEAFPSFEGENLTTNVLINR